MNCHATKKEKIFFINVLIEKARLMGELFGIRITLIISLGGL